MTTGEAPQRTKTGAAFEPKTFASGRFVVQRLLGEGGQKTVYLARDTQLDRSVAIAVIKTQGLDEGGIARVRREAQTLARLGAQPHIVTMYDIGQEQEPDGRQAPYLVCEYIAGGDLEQELRQAGGPLPLERVLAIGQDLCRALEVAHSRGILHRDIKPGNVWLTEDGRAKLGDFGLAMALGQSRLTEAGSVMGTASYMPPEQALGSEVDVRGDLYALGCLLYELVTGRPPFLGDDTIAVVSQHINTAPVAASWHRAGLPGALDALIERLLEKSPGERPESASAVLEALATIAAAPAGGAVPLPGDANSLDRLAGGVFVGREGETQQIRAALDRALSGQGNLVLLAGEPGIGKTRLAEELTTYARLRGAQALWGRCYEGEGAPAYWPWVQAIRAYAHEREPEALRSELGTGAADIAQVVSEVRERLPDLPAPAAMEPEQARFRLFDSIATFLKNAANAQPLVLILDDLHWADKPSLLLLQFVARGLRGARLLLVGTYRDVEVRRQHPLSATLAELAREQLSQRVVLRGLSSGEVARFIEMSCGVTPPEGLVAAVHKDTEGNPFFVKEVVNLLAREGRLSREEPTTTWTVAIPQSVREVVGRRLDGLSEECNKVLTIAAVIGREFDHQTLERITSLPGDTVLDLLEETVAARIIDELPDTIGRYSFSHGLIRETLYEELTGARRARLHRQIGEALEQAYASRIEAHLAELAYHFFEAARGGAGVDKAIEYATRAARRAGELVAHEEAARLYELALEASELRDTYQDKRHCELLLALGETLWKAGEFTNARAVFGRAVALAEQVGAPELLARAALQDVGQTAGFAAGTVNEEQIAWLRRALQLLDPADTALRAKVMSLLADALTSSGLDEERVSLSQEALRLARELSNPDVLVYVLLQIHWTLWSPDNLDDRLAWLLEARQLGQEQENESMVLSSRVWLLGDRLEIGDMAGIEEEIESLIRAAEQRREPYEIWFARMLRARLALHTGHFDEVERLAQEALQVGQEEQNQNAVQLYGAQMFQVRRDQGRLEEIELAVRAAANQFAATLPAWRCGLSLVYTELGREEEARAEFERLAANDFADLPRDMFWLAAMSLLADVSWRLNDARRAEMLYELLLPFAARHGHTFSVGLGVVARYLGLLAATLARWEDAFAHFEAGIAEDERVGARPWAAHGRYQYADMLLRRNEAGDRERALALLDEALATARELGMPALAAQVAALQSHS